ncbi:hypothetical protein CCR75_003619 [Bremia lactucae]|uniref:Uncharacterized protein n=1 Tax=Bremia lactucae TaxID=4779 RepID=A0A976IBN5_BRELC|nr:hypothetical protein CCR75_003619 [Bremia lactucae]
MKIVYVLATFLTLLGSVQSVNIESGFTLDGSTTYCMGVSAINGSVGTLNFDTLEAGNVGRCPVGVTLTLTDSKFRISDPIIVKWAATAIVGLPNAIFSNAIDAATGLPAPVTMSTLFACTVGTNCATSIRGTPTGDGTSSGAFPPGGFKTLETNTFTFGTAGDYIIVGLVTLPGDSALNLLAEEYLVFKSISIVPDDSVFSSSTSSRAVKSSEVTSGKPDSTSDSDKTGLAKGITPNDNISSNTIASPSADTAKQMDAEYMGVVKTASVFSGSSTFVKDNGVLIIAAVILCCILGFLGAGLLLRRRKNQQKGLDGNTSSDADDDGGKTDLTYIANMSARNIEKTTDNMMDEELPVIMMPSMKHGSEHYLRTRSSRQSLTMNGSDTDDFFDKASHGAAAYLNAAAIDPHRMSSASSVAGGQSEASMSNFGDSIVSARQKKYLQPNDGKDAVSARTDAQTTLFDQAQLKAHEQSNAEEFSAIGRYTEEKQRNTGSSNHDLTRELGFSMSSRPGSESRPSEDYRATEESRDSKNSFTGDFSEALGQSRLQSEVSVDSYGFRASRLSVDSYSSGMSFYSREGSRISGFSSASSFDRSSTLSKY